MMTKRGNHPSRRAFTLLELLLAATVMATLTALLGALVAQTRQWGGDQAMGERAIRLARVMTLIREQWGDRRMLPLAGDGPSVQLNHDRLEFVTARAVVDPSRALVRAIYAIEPDWSGPPEAGARWRLVYREYPYVDFSGGERSESERLSNRSGEPDLVLLSQCPALAWERRAMVDEDGAEVADLEDDDAPALASPASGDAPPAPRVPVAEARLGWAAMKQRDRASAVARLRGVAYQQEFSWVFVVRASRS